MVADDPDASEAGSDEAGFTVVRTGSTQAPLTVYYSVGGTATAGDDYSALSRRVTIPAGAGSAPIAIAPSDDDAEESAETVVITLSAKAAYSVGVPASATATIADDDEPAIPGPEPKNQLYLPVVVRVD